MKSTADTPQPLLDHLDELRKRIIASLVWFVLLSFGVYFFVDPILAWLAKPVGQFVFTSPTEAFFIRFRISFGLGAILAVPVFIYQLWKFISIALNPNERSWVKGIVPAACILFFVGMALAVFGVAPIAVHFLLEFSTPYLRPLIRIEDYLSFIFWMIIGFGLLFQLPLVIVVLSRLGIVDPHKLGHYRRHVFVGILIVAAVLTPGPDVFSQLLLTVPSYILFECSLLVARRMKKKKDDAR